MRQLLRVVFAVYAVVGTVNLAHARCGSDPGDAAAVDAAVAGVSAQCDCCAPRATFAKCVSQAVKASVIASSLPRRCAGTVRRNVVRACPLRPRGVACRRCNADADCGAGEFCECPAGTCSKTGGTCVARPQLCTQSYAPVCGCDGTTYSNDCVRSSAAACKAHDGACVATTSTLPPPQCTTDADCDDGNGCTVDRCVNQTCEHVCVCVGPGGAAACCPGPAALCAIPCGDTFPACNGACPAGSTCGSLTGAPACQCIAATCQPGEGKYFPTCGDPVCGGHRDHSGVPPCTTEQPGQPCSCIGRECDPGDACNALLECATSDPTHGGMCPISRRRYKTDIDYLGAADVKRLHDQLLAFPLASYRYDVPGAPADRHVGFVIDDVEPSPAVAASGDTVDLYGYATMAVAAVQEQARQIASLQRQVEELQRELDRSRAKRTGMRR